MVNRALWALLLSALNLALARTAAPPETEAFWVPAGTLLHCRVTETLTTKLNSQGDTFTLTVAEPVTRGGRVAIPVGATLRGRIREMDLPGRLKGVGRMRLVVEQITFPSGITLPLAAVLMSAYGADQVRVVGSEGLVEGPSSRASDLKEIGAGTGGGMVWGLIFAHPFVGATLGATATTIDRLRRRGKDLTIPVGTQLNYQLTRGLEIGPATARTEVGAPAGGAGH